MDKTGAEQVIHGRSQPFFSDIKRIAKEALFAKGLFRNLFLHFLDKKKEVKWNEKIRELQVKLQKKL